MSKWVEQAYEAIDRRDAAGFADFLTDDVWFRFGNAEPIVGREAVREALEGFFGSVQGVRHHLSHEWRFDNHVILVADVDYTRSDGQVVTVPGATIYELEGDLARRVQIFIDLAPLFAPATETALAG